MGGHLASFCGRLGLTWPLILLSPFGPLQACAGPQARRPACSVSSTAAPACRLAGALLVCGLPAGRCWPGEAGLLLPVAAECSCVEQQLGSSRPPLHSPSPDWPPLLNLQANYAAANAALDAWSHAWQAAGGASKAVQWGAWASSGEGGSFWCRKLHCGIHAAGARSDGGLPFDCCQIVSVIHHPLQAWPRRRCCAACSASGRAASAQTRAC